MPPNEIEGGIDLDIPDQTPLERCVWTLLALWDGDVAFQSSAHAMAAHPACRALVGLGAQAVPVLVDALGEYPHLAMLCLRSLTGADPATGVATVEGALRAWEQWYAHKGSWHPQPAASP